VLGVLDKGLTQMAVNAYVREVLVGAIIIDAVGAARVARRA
jgi:ribose transport system permease protein